MKLETETPIKTPYQRHVDTCAQMGWNALNQTDFQAYAELASKKVISRDEFKALNGYVKKFRNY